MAMPLRNHWLPLAALLLRIFTFRVITGVAGLAFTVTAKDEVVPFPQVFTPFTTMVPDTAVALKFTVILFVLAPDATVAPVGNTQL